MNIALKDTTISLSSEGTEVLLSSHGVNIDNYAMDFPGEYERGGIFVEIREYSNTLLYILTIEGKVIIFLTEGTKTESLETLRDLNEKDMVIFPASESLWKTVETWEASVVVPYGAETENFLAKLGQTTEKTLSTTIKSAEFE